MRIRPALAALLLAAGSVPALTGCGSFAQSSPPAGVDGLTIPTPDPRPHDFVGSVDNPWFPLPDRATRTFDVTGAVPAGTTRTVEVVPGRVEVAGVSTTAVRSTLGDTLGTDYYAQDRRGNVWWFGHDGGGRPWRTGQDGAQAGLAMAATPRTGDGYRTAYLAGVVQDVATVVDVEGDTVLVDVTSTLSPGGVSRETYRRGIGLVARLDAGTGEYDELRR